MMPFGIRPKIAKPNCLINAPGLKVKQIRLTSDAGKIEKNLTSSSL